MNKSAVTELRIPFNRPTRTGHEDQYLLEAMNSNKIGPGGRYVAACQDWLADRFHPHLALTTGSCTAALEISAILLRLKPGDEVIVPSFAYPSTANAFARTGARLVFVDIDPATMNPDPDAIAEAITPNTRAIVLIHYAGIAADMDRILDIANAHSLPVVEDAALVFLAKHRGRLCGTLGHFGCFSFHETKTVHCGQGGTLLVNTPEHVKRAEIVLEKGTDRRQFLRKEVDRYSWRDIGSAYALDNIRAAFLFGQFEQSDAITADRVAMWYRYHALLAPLAESGRIELPFVPDYAEINGHIYWIKTADEPERDELVAYLADQGVHAIFHYVPLHSADAGLKFGRFSGEDRYTTREASRLLRLPLYRGLDEIDFVVDRIIEFFRTR